MALNPGPYDSRNRYSAGIASLELDLSPITAPQTLAKRQTFPVQKLRVKSELLYAPFTPAEPMSIWRSSLTESLRSGTWSCPLRFLGGITLETPEMIKLEQEVSAQKKQAKAKRDAERKNKIRSNRKQQPALP